MDKRETIKKYNMIIGITQLRPVDFFSILDDRLKEKYLKRWKDVLCIHFHVCVCQSVCLSVCNRATEHTFWHRKLILGLSDL